MAPMLTVIVGTFMVVLDNTVVNVALPQLGQVFGAELSLLQWVITAYFLAQAAVIPLSGWMSDRFGAKRIYLISLVLFSLGSALCGLAISAQTLIAARVVQGLGGGMLMPIGMAVLFRLTPPQRRGAIFALFGIPIMVAPALGPVLGGYLVEFASWRYIFLLNVPIGAVALVMGLRALPALPASRAVGALDTLGVVLAPLAFASLSFGISQSTHYGWTGAPTLVGIAVGLVALALFIWRELTFPYPLLELRVFRSRDFSFAIVTQWVAFGAMFGSFFLIPLFLQQVRGYGAFESGLVTIPQALASMVFMQVGGRLFDRIGARPPVLAGLILVAGSMYLMTGVTGTTTGRDMIPALVLMGAGMGLMMMSLNTHMLNAAPRDLTSRVTALSQSLNNVVSSLAIATFATILQARVAFHVTEAALLTGGQPGPQALMEASAMAFADVYRTALGVVLFAWLLAWTLRPLPAPGKPGKPEGGIAEGSRSEGAPEQATARVSGVSGVSEVEREPVLVGH
jgi:EmrB/QacA subfamily drug resistance transporter